MSIKCQLIDNNLIFCWLNKKIIFLLFIFSFIFCLKSNAIYTDFIGGYDAHDGAYNVFVLGNTAYVTTYSKGLLILDVSDPSEPKLLGSYDISGSATINGVYVIGSTAYLAHAAADGSIKGSFIILDVSDPSEPKLLGSYDNIEAGHVYVSGTTAYIAAGEDGLLIIDVSDPSAPILIGSYNVFEEGYAGEVYVSGTTAYIAAGEDGLLIIDVNDPSAPILIGSYDSKKFDATSIYVSDTTAYIAIWNYGLKLIDITNPSAPEFLGSIETYNARRVYISDTLAYVADGDGGLLIIDVSDPTSPKILSRYIDTYGIAMGVYVLGTTIYAPYATIFPGTGGLAIIRSFPEIEALSKKKGKSKSKLVIRGTGFGNEQGTVLMVRKKLKKECNIIFWRYKKIKITIPVGFKLGWVKIFVKDIYSGKSNGRKFYYKSL